MSVPPSFWTACGHQHLNRNARGWLQPTPDYWRLWLHRPELALVPESCPAEKQLHQSLLNAPDRAVALAELDAIADEDARQNYQLFLRFRDEVESAGSLESAYMAWMHRGRIELPPLFIDLVVQAIACNVLRGVDDAWAWRAAELLFRRQRITVQNGRVLAGDSDTLDALQATGGLGEMGRLLMEAGAPLKAVDVKVLHADNAQHYFAQREGLGRYAFLLDLTHEIQNKLPHGLILNMVNARSGLKALSFVLARWVQHFLGVAVQIEPVQQVDDPAWRWHVGLDATATALLNDLYQGQTLDARRQQQLISLFTLRFADPQAMRTDVRGKPVYLGLAMDAQGLLKLKPQNLLINLPLAKAV
ncbi:DUF6352 family protein [Limnohabitans sp.]|uniref:DUF6352 family protein n=1 Tax=Limnohabitans sp. TaxID=1907725 RepID=UPI0035AFBBA4